ncbi:MAG: hypothetical protein AB7O32_14890 [Vicinamibacterales bacterium]
MYRSLMPSLVTPAVLVAALVAALSAVLVSPAAAQEPAAGAIDKGWVDVTFGTATAAEDAYTSTAIRIIDQEAGGGSVAYGLPRGASFDVGGGYMFSRRVGVGISLAGTAHEDTAGLAVSVPHPLYFDASAMDAGVTDGTLTRAEGAWHLHAMLVAAETRRIRVRVFGGPSYFLARQDVVTAITYDQRYQVFGRGNQVDINGVRTAEREGTGWGWHAGGDVSWFFSRVAGIGALVRVSGGSVAIDDYGGRADRKVGGVQMGGGLRLRF